MISFLLLEHQNPDVWQRDWKWLPLHISSRVLLDSFSNDTALLVSLLLDVSTSLHVEGVSVHSGRTDIQVQ
jgi:hypothetical protein